MDRVSKVWKVLLVFLTLLSANAWAADTKVVVIPMGDSRQQRQLYIPAMMFRPVLNTTAWKYEEDGGVINPEVASSDWIVPIPLPDGTRIKSLELVYKNAGDETFVFGRSAIMLLFVTETSGASGKLFEADSWDYYKGVKHLKSTFNFTLTDSLHANAYVHMENTDRWIIGLKVVYLEP